MNKKLQELIKIVEPYMDKTLSEGCYIDSGDLYTDEGISIEGKIVYIKHEQGYKEYGVMTECGIENIYANKEEEKEIQILGHLDLSAVLRYVLEKKRWNLMEIEIEYEWIYINHINDCHNLPNKPLITYSEEELESLISLLNELGKR